MSRSLKTALRRSPGGEACELAVGGVLVAAALALPVAAQQAAESGAEAFARSDFAAAAELWRKEAAAGSAEAKFGLGLISDLGLGVPRDAAKAMRWYLEAADDGFSNAQFNVAVMLDAGTGVPRDVGAAAVWYGREPPTGTVARSTTSVAIRGRRGRTSEPRSAWYWLSRSAEVLPAAAERLATLAPARSNQRTFTAPGILAGAIVTNGNAQQAEMVWSAPPGPPGAPFLLEVARLPAGDETSGTIVVSALTEASARIAQLPGRSAAYAWRVSLVDTSEARYAAGPWRRLSSVGEAGPWPCQAAASQSAWRPGTRGPGTWRASSPRASWVPVCGRASSPPTTRPTKAVCATPIAKMSNSRQGLPNSSPSWAPRTQSVPRPRRRAW